MPLKRGSSRQTVSSNIGELRRSGYPEKQAAAIAYREAEEKKDAVAPGASEPHGPLPLDHEPGVFGQTFGFDAAPTGLPATFTIADMKKRFGG